MNEKGLIVVGISGIEYKTIQDKAGKDAYFSVSGYLSTFGNLDLVDDVCVRGCFADTLKTRTPKLLNQHKWDEPVGAFDKLEEDDKGLYFEAVLPLADDFVRGRLVPQIKVGSIDSMSIGYNIVEATWDDATGTRYLKKLDLWEGSFVTFPANPEARLDTIKSMMENYKSKKAVEEYPVASKTHKWEREKADERTKGMDKPEMPVFDCVEGKLVVVPPAMFCLKAQLIGAKGGYEGNIEAAKKFLNKYYEKINLEAPFKEGKDVAFCETEIKNMPVSELSYILRNGKLSKSCADYLARMVVASTDEAEGKPDETGDLIKAMKEWSVRLEKETENIRDGKIIKR